MSRNNTQTKDAFPLSWPLGTKRTEEPISSRFKITLAKAYKSLISELDKLGAKNIIVSTDIPLKADGTPYANYKLDDNGVAVYFDFMGESTVLCCDKWKGIHENMFAISKTVDAMRGIDRWGVSDMMKKMFIGFQALPEFSSSLSRPWYEVLEVSENASQEDIKTAYRSKSKILHPDIPGTGDKDKFNELGNAYAVGMSK